MTDRPRGARVRRWIVLGILAVVVVWLLFSFVFPWVESRFYDPTVGTTTAAWLGTRFA